MEFVRLKYANNKLINANLKEHREIIDEYVRKRGYTYLGFIPVLFGPNGKMLELDLIFKKNIPPHRPQVVEQKPATIAAATPKPEEKSEPVIQ
ncbi:hypothetical protein IJ101_01670 [Candidatus Saccharibacteria bacterium]|nr:hypothetical protein [Candidatus Saccharibacteria bacterium]